MARHGKMSESPAPFRGDDLYEASPPPSSRRNINNGTHPSMSPSPLGSISSDKENRSSRPSTDKGRGRVPMGPPSLPAMRDGSTRKRPADQEQSGDRARRRRTVEAEEEDSDVDYDPDQDRDERRQLRKGLRNLSKNLVDNRAEYLAPNSTGLRDTILRANELSNQVKQTADATIDSRLLVVAADFSLKKTVALCSGDTAQGVDIDEFLTKVKQYMRLGGAADEAPSNTQRRRRRQDDDDDDDNDGDSWNWGYFGRHACVKHILRPSVPGFLLGPLSVEKRARRPIVRQERLKHTSIKEVRPEVLESGDIEKNENANLTTLCHHILSQLRAVQLRAMSAVEASPTDDLSEQETENLLDKYGVSLDGGIALFKFVINPFSFGQTVENMFYVSFLIRDGKLGISLDNRGLPYLEIPASEGEEGTRKSHKPKHQAVLALDMKEWQELIDVFDIKEPIIKHREEEDPNAGHRKGWYA